MMSKGELGALIAAGLAIFLGFFGFLGLIKNGHNMAQQPESWSIPGSTNISPKGNGWYTFDYDGNHYLYHRQGAGNTLVETVTQVENH